MSHDASGAFDDLDLAYKELRAIAERLMRSERADHTLQPTALVHEAYLKLRGQRPGWDNREHFVSVASLAMRQVLVDCARHRLAHKRHGQRVDEPLTQFPKTPGISALDLIAIHRALDALAARSPNGTRQARLIELVWFGGMRFGEAAAKLEVSRRQAHRDWAFARTWLEREIIRA